MNTIIRERIQILHSELSALDTVEARDRELLMTLLGDITRLLERSSGGTADEHTLVERLDELAVHFEAEHPSLGAALRRVVDALSKAGI
ncbi:MAG: DUF4404 family protein [Povalibacter sp.]